MNILLTGSSGFVGTNLSNYLNNDAKIYNVNKSELHTRQFAKRENIDAIIHLAGIAHDLENNFNISNYFEINTEYTKNIYDYFLESNASTFIFISSVKAVKDTYKNILTEEVLATPNTTYGKSKFYAEQYILNSIIPLHKRVFILRPCMIHGNGNKGNLNLLYKFILKGFPWPLGSFENKRSFCSVDNLCFIINEIIRNNNIQPGVYNIADDEPLSTNELIRLIAYSQGRTPKILYIPKSLITAFFKICDLLRLPINTENFDKLTENYIVSNNKIKKAINKSLPLISKDGLIKTFNSFNNS